MMHLWGFHKHGEDDVCRTYRIAQVLFQASAKMRSGTRFECLYLLQCTQHQASQPIPCICNEKRLKRFNLSLSCSFIFTSVIKAFDRHGKEIIQVVSKDPAYGLQTTEAMLPNEHFGKCDKELWGR